MGILMLLIGFILVGVATCLIGYNIDSDSVGVTGLSMAIIASVALIVGLAVIPIERHKINLGLARYQSAKEVMEAEFDKYEFQNT